MLEEMQPLIGPYAVEYELAGETSAGELYHVEWNECGGSNSTPVGRWFCWKSEGDVECFNDHWRIDCFIRDHDLAPPDPMMVGKALVSHLKRDGKCAEPIWLGVHRYREMDGEAYGDLYQDD